MKSIAVDRWTLPSAVIGALILALMLALLIYGLVPHPEVPRSELPAALLNGIQHARQLAPGEYRRDQLPAALQLERLVEIQVDRRGAYVFEFESEIPIYTNRVYLFVEPHVPDPEGVARTVCEAKKTRWTFSKKLPEVGWYKASGP